MIAAAGCFVLGDEVLQVERRLAERLVAALVLQRMELALHYADRRGRDIAEFGLHVAGVNAKTLADFRVGHGAALEQLLVDSFTALTTAGVASLNRIPQDGVRVRAAAGAASFRRHSTLEECRAEATAALDRLRREATSDPGAASRREAAARMRAAQDREHRVAKAEAAAKWLWCTDIGVAAF